MFLTGSVELSAAEMVTVADDDGPGSGSAIFLDDDALGVDLLGAGGGGGVGSSSSSMTRCLLLCSCLLGGGGTSSSSSSSSEA